MTRYIDETKIRFTGKSFIDDNKEIYVKLSDVRQAIAQTPTADVEEVKHGKWKIKCDDYDCEYMMCSCCKEEFYPVDEDTVDTTPNYCPNCGAKMDGGKTG
jgi:hypothetical protein